MIDERLTYHTFLASDKQLRTLENPERATRRSAPTSSFMTKSSSMAKAISPINSITILEFKRPERDDYSQDDNPVIQSLELVNSIRSGEFKDAKGRPHFCGK